ncbi:MAG: hypothetical protein NXY57DRAFT_962656 [Lentinula lateritia]|nr:MAG: hypothetical protein NXY57DRAFT_962656 [Lentinula lateritia]
MVSCGPFSALVVMPSCPGCLEVFTGITDGENCAKCRKLTKGLTKIEMENIQSQPACHHCSAHSPFLAGKYCGKCLRLGLDQEEDDDATRSVATYVGRHAEIWSKTVSEHHLGQPNSKQNRNLAKAIAVNEKKARIKKLTKGQTFQVELSLMLVDMKGKHHKSMPRAPIPPLGIPKIHWLL